MPHPNDPSLYSFIPVDPASDFPIQNLPYGVFSSADGLAPRVGVAIGDFVLDLWELEQDCRLDVGPLGVFSASSLNPFMALGPQVWARTRAKVSELLRHDNDELRDNEELRRRALVPMAQTKLHSLLEISWNGSEPIELADGVVRTFLEDGDSLVMRGWCQGAGYRVGFGEVEGTILPTG